MNTLALTLLLSASLLAMPLHAQETPGGSAIAAVVNDDVISTLDIQNRVRFIIATARLSDTPETRAQLMKQVLSSLLDEHLQLQESTRQGVTVSDDDVNQAIRGLEAQRGMAEGEMLSRIDQMGVPRVTFLDQIRAQLAWTKLVIKKIRPQVKITDDELDRERAKANNDSAAPGTGEVQIEILPLPVDKPENEAQVKALADKLVQEMRAGASFESVARELKSSASDLSAVKPFWVDAGALDKNIAAALETAPKGSISDPVRTLEGYTIVHLLDRRGAQVNAAPSMVSEVVVKDIIMQLKNDAVQQDVDLALAIGREVAKNPGNCTDTGIAGVSELKDFNITVQFRRDMLENLSDTLRDIVSKLQIGGVSEPYASQEGIRLFMLCERVEKPAPLADMEETRQRLYAQKMELEAQKYLRQLRRDAAIDVRL